MLPVRSSVSKRCAYVVVVIFLLGEIMSSYSHYKEKKLVCVVIIAPFSRQLSSYIKYTKSNIHLSCNIKSISNTEYIFRFLYNIHSPSHLQGRNT